MKGWVDLVGWPVADGLPTLVVTHGTGKVRQSETDVLPLCHATNLWHRYKTKLHECHRMHRDDASTWTCWAPRPPDFHNSSVVRKAGDGRDWCRAWRSVIAGDDAMRCIIDNAGRSPSAPAAAAGVVGVSTFGRPAASWRDTQQF